MEFNIFLSYIVAITVLIASPGPSSILIALHGYKYGVWQTHKTIVGNLLGSIVLITLSLFGIGALLSTSQTAFLALQIFGMAFLVYLAINMILHADKVIKVGQTTPKNMFLQGFLAGVSNPKDILFLGAFLPSFMDHSAPVVSQSSILIITWVVVDYCLKIFYVKLGKSMSTKMSKGFLPKLFSYLSAAVMLLIVAIGAYRLLGEF